MSNPVTSPWSSGSYGFGGFMEAEVVSVNDPLRSNRVQVRVKGYQHDEGLIPDDKLPWIRVLAHNSQLKGAGGTHLYFPKAKVIVGMVGDQMVIHGAISGFDSLTRGDEPDTGESKEPDMPKQVQGKEKQVAKATDGKGEDKTAKKGYNPKTDKPFEKPEEEDVYQNSKTTAPYDKGQPAKFPDLKSIGFDKLLNGEDVLEKIKSMDGNASGAIKSALDIIKNLRNNGFGTSNDVIGGGNISAAANQFVQDFGAGPAIDILALLKELAACLAIVKGATPLTTYQLSQDGSLLRCVNALAPTTFGLSLDFLQSMIDVITTISGSPNGNQTQNLAQFDTLFMTGVHQAVSAASDFLNNLASTAGSPQAMIAMFNDPQNFVDLCSILVSLGASIGITAASFAPTGQGAVGIAINQGIGGVAAAASQGRGSGGGGGQNALGMIGKITAALNMFAKNPIAMGEMSSGQIDPTSLLKIPLKYVPKRENHPQKKFAD